MKKLYCYICYKKTYEEFFCDKCENYYCEECSYTFTIHYQFQGARCYSCADQSRLKPLISRDHIRDNILSIILND